MKPIILSLFALGLASGAQAEDFHVSAPVIAAKLYTQEADITRAVKIAIPSAGVHRLIVSPLLSHNIHDIAPKITGGKLLTRTVQALFVLPESEQPLWQQIDAARESVTVLQHSLSENEKLAAALLKRAARAKSDLAEIESALAKLRGQHQDLQQQQSAAQKKLAALEMAAKWRGQERPKMQQSAVFAIQVDHPGEVTLTFQEHTPRASWEPYSEVRLDSQKQQIAWQAGAQIVQNTGLDWHNVALTLALTPPNYIARPDLQTTTVAVVDKVVNENSKKATTRMKNFAAKDDAAIVLPVLGEFAAPAPTAYNAAPQIHNNGLDFTVTLPGQYSLAANGDRYQIPYLEESSAATVYSGVYSWDTPEALLVAEWQQPAGKGFIPGETTIYRDQNRLTSLYLGEIWAGGAKHILSFGKDPQITVDYHTPPGYTAGSGIILKDKILEKRESIQLKNLATTAKPVRVYSRIPVTTQQEVKVEGQFNPPPSEQNVDDVKGIYLWQKTLQPNEEWNINSGYDIRYPEGKRLIGLD